ncbi:MAG TPA: hypothetical protein VG796_22420 [Verrucomicrobiales bacterium]|nr:hypothetical protein [Verrucomicrobiales bacterium]
MPKLTIASGATGTIPSTQRFNVPAARKALVFTLISGDAWWGWSPTVSASGAGDAGIPMVIGSPVTMASERFDFSAAVNIHSPAGCVIHYQEITV